MNLKDDHTHGGRNPQPAQLPVFKPPGFVHVHDRRTTNRLERFLVPRLQRRAHLLLHVRHAAERQRNTEHGFDNLLDAPLAAVASSTQVRQCRRQAGAERMLANLGGNLRARDLPAPRTGAGVRLILGNFRGPWRQFGRLMPCRERILRPHLLGQWPVAVCARRGCEMNDLGNALRRQSLAMMAACPGCPPAVRPLGGFFAVGCWLQGGSDEGGFEEFDELRFSFCRSSAISASNRATCASSSATRFSSLAQLGHAGFDAASLMLHCIGLPWPKNKGLNDYEMAKVRRLAGLAIETRRAGKAVCCFVHGHALLGHVPYPPADPGFFKRVNRSWFDQDKSIRLNAGDLVFCVGFDSVFQGKQWGEFAEHARRAGAKLAWSLTTYRTEDIHTIPADELLIDQHWALGDAVAAMDGYDIKILPTSGVLSEAVYWMVNAELCGLGDRR